MNIVVDTFIKETAAGNYKADVYQSEQGFGINYYSPDGALINSETFSGKSKFYVESAAQNWLAGIKSING